MSHSEVTVAATSDPPPSDDELMLHQWIAELSSFINLEAIRNANTTYDETWEKALKTVETPKYKDERLLRVNNPDADDLKNMFKSIWKKIRNQIKEVRDDR